MTKTTKVAAGSVTALVAAGALWFSQQQTLYATLGDSLKARGQAYACWLTNPDPGCVGPNCGLQPKVTPFRPEFVMTAATDEQRLARYGAGSDRRSWALQENVAHVSQIAERVVRHKDNVYNIVDNESWTLNGDYPNAVNDLFAVCGGSPSSMAFHEMERLDAALFPPEPGPTPEPTATGTPTATPPLCPPGCIDLGLGGGCSCPSPTPTATATATPVPTATPCPSCPPAPPRCPPLTATCQAILGLGGDGGLKWVEVRPGQFRRSQWAQCRAQALRPGCVR